MFDKYRITMVDGTVIEPEGRKADVVRWERQFHKPISQFFGDEGIYTESLWFLAWCAARRADESTAAFDDWIDLVESVEINPEASTENPSDPSPSPSA